MKDKSVLVIGGGIAGIQASLDLADKGVEVHLVEREPSIGGRMAQLDKTFPTNDCSICILAPKMADCFSHENIHVMTYSEVQSVSGKPGNFNVEVLKKARYVDPEKCTGCGECIEKCPSKVPSEFDMGLGKRRAIYMPFMQAVPRVCTIDAEHCQKLIKDKCGNCEKVCEAEAINYEDNDEIVKLNVGSIIAAVGFEGWDPSAAGEYGYGKYPNVFTALEFERLLSAAGPTTGHIKRRSDGNTPKNIAFIQCVGSRDVQHGNPYCSSVCCMHAVKEAIIAKEHDPDLKTHIFFMDLRAFGKEFDEYCIRAEKKLGVKFTRNNRISHISEDHETKNLKLSYIEGDKLIEEEFGMVVLSACMKPPKDVEKLAEILGIKLNSFNFCSTDQLLSPSTTSKPGIYVSGVFGAPKDIPDSVAESSGAATSASTHISEGGFKFVPKKVYPEELKVKPDEVPKVGVFICHCGHNIAGFLDVPEVVDYVKTLPYVVHAEDNLYTCADDGLTAIRDAVKEQNLNRVVVASCTPRTHSPLFMTSCKEAGLNEYLFEMANIRDQCSWVHMKEPEKATQKAKDLLRMAVAKVSLQNPLERVHIPVKSSALIIGGGVSGMNAALEMAKNGFDAFLVEKESELGGLMRRVHYELAQENDKIIPDVQERLKQLIDKVKANKRVRVYTNSTLKDMEGFVGNFKSIIEQNGKEEQIEHGVVIVATGGQEYKPTEYLYGQDERIMTQLELEEKLAKEGNLDAKTFVMIHCIGCRNEERPYCSRICCVESIKNSLKIKELKPDAYIYHIFRDMRTYGFNELHYIEAARKGVRFFRYHEDEPPVVTNENGLEVRVKDQFLDEEIILKPDIVALAAATVPNLGNEELAKKLKVPLSKDKFFLEAHMKLRPVDFATDGIFLCGLAQFPKFFEDCISQSNAAVSRACTILSRDYIASEGIISQVDEESCCGCRTCETVCPFNAIQVNEKETGWRAEVIAAACKGCGSCATACPEGAIIMLNYTDDQLISAGTTALLETEMIPPKEEKIPKEVGQ